VATLIVEDGSGKTNANAYISRADLATYFEDRNDTAMAEQEDEALDAAILYATRDMDQSWDFHGIKTSTDQALAWPRVGAYDKEEIAIDNDVVPAVVVEACSERAREHLLVRALNDAIDPTAELDALTVGPISLDWSTGELSPMPRNDFYMKLLRGLTIGTPVSHEIVRA
jgi:hypothetical protein